MDILEEMVWRRRRQTMTLRHGGAMKSVISFRQAHDGMRNKSKPLWSGWWA